MPPKGANSVTNAKTFSQDWVTVAKQLVAEAPVPTPESTPIADAHEIRIYSVAVSNGQRTRLYTGYPADDTDALCQAYANFKKCRVVCYDGVETKMCEWLRGSSKEYHPESTPIADAHEIRIYAVDSLTGDRQRLFTGQPSDDTDNLCQAYATLAECRVESHDAASAKVYHPETSTIPTLADWVEVHNANDGTLIFVGLREKGFDARCRKYADAKRRWTSRRFSTP